MLSEILKSQHNSFAKGNKLKLLEMYVLKGSPSNYVGVLHHSYHYYTW